MIDANVSKHNCRLPAFPWIHQSTHHLRLLKKTTECNDLKTHGKCCVYLQPLFTQTSPKAMASGAAALAGSFDTSHQSEISHEIPVRVLWSCYSWHAAVSSGIPTILPCILVPGIKLHTSSRTNPQPLFAQIEKEAFVLPGLMKKLCQPLPAQAYLAVPDPTTFC